MDGALRSQRHAASRLTLRHYAHETLRSRLGRVAFELRHTRQSLDAERIHDLRVSIRRLTAALRIFGDAVPAAEAKRVRGELKEIMELAGAVRELDIALELAAKAGVAEASPLAAILGAQRGEGERRLLEAVRSAWRRNASLRWRERLQLHE